jgi:hypothetical protein
MGLDMYLVKKTYVKNWKHNEKNGVPEWKITVKHYGKKTSKIDSSKITHVEEEVCTWRKANAIHKWFVENVQDGNDDCGIYYVEREKLKELRDICQKVVSTAIIKKGIVQNGSSMMAGESELTPDFEEGEMIMNEGEIEAILPTASGFFFGSTNYDQWYMEDVKYTLIELTKALESQSSGDFYYSSSW